MSAMSAPGWTLPEPEAIHRPADVVECLADGGGDPWVPVGTGTSLARGEPPTRPARIMELSRLNRVLEHAHEDLTVTVEAGATLETVQSCLSERGQWLPVDPCPASSGTVGGMIGADRRSPLAGGLGTVRDYLIGVGFVDGRARRVAAGGRVVKNVAGYDLMKLLTGSLGELGVVVEATFKVLPRPETWGGVRLDGPDPGHCEAALTQASWGWFPTGLWRGNLGDGDHLLAVFAGPRRRVQAQIQGMSRLWGDGASRLEEAEVMTTLHRLQSRLVARERMVGWGGALPSFLGGDAVCRTLGSEAWWADLESGHLWWFPDGDVSKERIGRIRAGLRGGEGHLHLDCPKGIEPGCAVWGSDPGGETILWKHIKRALDPEERLVAGRLPGGV